jgi:hypothetical protein
LALDHVLGKFDFVCIWLSGEKDSECQIDLVIGVLSCVAKQAFGEPFGLLDNEGAVEQVQGLQWGIGSGAFGYYLVAAWAIESAEDRVLFRKKRN